MSHRPSFEGAIEGWVVNFLKTNYWRVEATCERQDCMQSAYVVFLRCQRRYSKTVSEPKHFMALFKTAWTREFTDMANADTKARQASCEPEAYERQHMAAVGELENEGELRVLIAQAPSEVRMVLSLFLDAPQEVLELALQAWRQRGHHDAGGSRQVDVLLGLPRGSDALGATARYFGRDGV